MFRSTTVPLSAYTKLTSSKRTEPRAWPAAAPETASTPAGTAFSAPWRAYFGSCRISDSVSSTSCRRRAEALPREMVWKIIASIIMLFRICEM